MNISILLGALFGIVVIGYSIVSSVTNTAIFFNFHGIFIVFGGTLAVSMICFNFGFLINSIKVLIKKVIGESKKNIIKTIDEITNLSKAIQNGGNLQSQLSNLQNPFLKECCEIMGQGILSSDELRDVMDKRLEIQNEQYKREGLTYRVLGKFPPAFGLMGTCIGMIVLLQGLGGPDAFEKIGPSMSVALTATFWGLVLANLILIPVGEHLQHAAEDDLTMRRIVIDGVMLVKEKKHPLLVEEYLKSYLSPNDRNKIKAV